MARASASTGGAQHCDPTARGSGACSTPSAGLWTTARPLAQGPRAYPIQAAPPDAHRRRPLGGRLRLGVRALDLFTPCCAGQRMGIFAGSGVGKSTLASMLARGSDADVLVIGLVGERGREVNEFLDPHAGCRRPRPERRRRRDLGHAGRDAAPGRLCGAHGGGASAATRGCACSACSTA